MGCVCKIRTYWDEINGNINIVKVNYLKCKGNDLTWTQVPVPLHSNVIPEIFR